MSADVGAVVGCSRGGGGGL